MNDDELRDAKHGAVREPGEAWQLFGHDRVVIGIDDSHSCLSEKEGDPPRYFRWVLRNSSLRFLILLVVLDRSTLRDILCLKRDILCLKLGLLPLKFSNLRFECENFFLARCIRKLERQWGIAHGACVGKSPNVVVQPPAEGAARSGSAGTEGYA